MTEYSTILWCIPSATLSTKRTVKSNSWSMSKNFFKHLQGFKCLRIYKSFWVHFVIIITFILSRRALIISWNTTTVDSYLAVQENYQTANGASLTQTKIKNAHLRVCVKWHETFSHEFTEKKKSLHNFINAMLLERKILPPKKKSKEKQNKAFYDVI